jgi:uncharacterized membrane protein YphA (DoxX/SURF4 family)
MSRMRMVAVWTLQILLGGLFVMLGVMKFLDPSWARSFARWGYPEGFHAVIGSLEAAGGAALMIPRLATPAALLLMAIMAGAGLTHLVHGEMRRLTAPVLYLLLIAIVGWLRRKSAVRLRRPTPPSRVVV